MLNKKAIKSFICCAHFLACQHIPHATNFEKLVELVVFCGDEDLKISLKEQEEMLCDCVYTS